VLQDHHLLFDRTVFDNVVLPLQVSGSPRREAERRVRAALDKVGLGGRESANPITLSGGEQQRVCLARAIVNRPALLLADEPTASLDAAAGEQILEMFRDFHRVGVTVLISTHDDALVSRFPGRVLRLENGTLASPAT
jgi:cell division transport system ATP-binding protein